MKNKFVYIVLVSLCMLFGGCTTKTTEKTNNPPQQSEGSIDASAPAGNSDIKNTDQIKVEDIKLVRKSDKTKYLLSNGIKLTFTERKVSTSKGEVKLLLLQISGLVNKKLEAEINTSLETDLYIAVKEYVKEINSLPFEGALSSVVELNANNLLSVSLRDFYSPPRYGLLYRLTDGKRLYLKDIFTEGTDYVSLVNRKVIEGILGGETAEEDFLSEPFSTITVNQNFSLSESTLNIIFNKGENGFINRTSVAIPLYSIDDYVDVADRYSGTERKTQQFTNLISRKNNIFTTQKGEFFKKSNGDIWAHYPFISGTRDAELEKIINGKIHASIDEVLGDSSMDKLTKSDDSLNPNHIATVNVDMPFNHYGVVSFVRYFYPFISQTTFDDFYTTFSYDLKSKKSVDVKQMLNNYFTKNKSYETAFTSGIKESFIKMYPSSPDNNVAEAQKLIDYPFILNKGLIYFSKYNPEDDIYIHVVFKANSFKGVPYTLDCAVPFKKVITGAPEDFFGW